MQKRVMLVLGLVMLVNALSYGMFIPLQYPYASRFGITPVGLSIMLALFSASQFIATPIIGRLSDRFGRKPLLLISLLGTSLSLAFFALAQTAWMLFAARILDGITGGNNSVAQAVIADTTTGRDRAKSFGLLGALFGVGFLLGPALGGLLSRISLTAPFFSASLTLYLVFDFMPASSSASVLVKSNQKVYLVNNVLPLTNPKLFILIPESTLTFGSNFTIIAFCFIASLLIASKSFLLGIFDLGQYPTVHGNLGIL